MVVKIQVVLFTLIIGHEVICVLEAIRLISTAIGINEAKHTRIDRCCDTTIVGVCCRDPLGKLLHVNKNLTYDLGAPGVSLYNHQRTSTSTNSPPPPVVTGTAEACT